MRTAKVAPVSMPPAELLLAKRLVSEQYWRQVHSFAKPKADALGFKRSDVTRLIEEYRKEKRGKGLTKIGK